MAEQDDSADKSHEPSQKKLDDARKKGEIARSADMLTACAYLGMLIAGFAGGEAALQGFGEAMLPFIENPHHLAELFFGGAAREPLLGLFMSSGAPLAVLFLAPFTVVLAALFATRGLVFAASKLVPKMSRLSPVENAKNKYGRRGLFEFVKSFAKLTIYSVCLAVFLVGQLDTVIGSARASGMAASAIMVDLVMRFLIIVVVVAGAMGAIDYLWQWHEHRRSNRMSQKDLRDEVKDAEGDPYIKQNRRARAQEIAMNRMMLDVPEADVVIVNPTHYAVALKWSRRPGDAPVCVAKGVDLAAARIRERAAEAQVPIRSDPPTARALYATTRIGQQIATEHYRPVAAAIRFAEDMRQRAKEKAWR